MTDHQAASRPGKAAVGDEGDRIPEPGADNRRRDGQHLAHPRPAARPLVPDHDNVVGLDGLTLDGVVRGLLAVEHARRTAMLQPIGA